MWAILSFCPLPVETPVRPPVGNQMLVLGFVPPQPCQSVPLVVCHWMEYRSLDQPRTPRLSLKSVEVSLFERVSQASTEERRHAKPALNTAGHREAKLRCGPKVSNPVVFTTALPKSRKIGDIQYQAFVNARRYKAIQSRSIAFCLLMLKSSNKTGC